MAVVGFKLGGQFLQLQQVGDLAGQFNFLIRPQQADAADFLQIDADGILGVDTLGSYLDAAEGLGAAAVFTLVADSFQVAVLIQAGLNLNRIGHHQKVIGRHIQAGSVVAQLDGWAGFAGSLGFGAAGFCRRFGGGLLGAAGLGCCLCRGLGRGLGLVGDQLQYLQGGSLADQVRGQGFAGNGDGGINLGGYGGHGNSEGVTTWAGREPHCRWRSLQNDRKRRRSTWLGG